MAGNIPIETYGIKHSDNQKREYISTYGDQTFEMVYIFRCIEEELSRSEIPPHILYQLIQAFLKAIKNKDPTVFHYNLARKIIDREQEYNKSNSQAVDLLARELCDTLNNLEEKIFDIRRAEEEKNALDKIAIKDKCPPSLFSIIEKKGKIINDECFNAKKEFKPLSVYLKIIQYSGAFGKKRAKEIRKEKVNSELSFWFEPGTKEPGEHFFHSAAFLGLTGILWVDKIKKRLKFDNNFPASIKKPTFDQLTDLFLAEEDRNNNIINIVKGADIIGKVEILAVPQNLHERIIRGVKKINTVICHKAIRYATALPFNQKLKGITHYMTRKYDRGFVEIGEEMGITSGKQLAELRDVLWVFHYLEMQNIKTSSVVSGNLLNLTKYKSAKTGRQDGIILTILPTLVDYGETSLSERLLIPMAMIAPPVNDILPPQYHASLYLLQMLIFKIFSDKSIEFYQYGCICIKDTDWNRLFNESNIPLKYKSEIISGWIAGVPNAPAVLEYVDKNHYKLGAAYTKSSNFLAKQGSVRAQNSLRGKILKRKKPKKYK